MKKLIVISLCFCCAIIQVKAQRYLPMQKGVQITAGWGDGYGFIKNKNVTFYGALIFSNITPKAHKWLYGVEYFEKRHCYKSQAVPCSQITAEGGYYYNFWSNRRKDVYISIGVSALAGYETINWGKKTFSDGASLLNKDHFIGGGAITLEIETFITDWLVFLVNVRERCLSSQTEKFHTQVGLGVKYIYK